MIKNRIISKFLSINTGKSKIVLIFLFIISSVLLFLPLLFDIDFKAFLAFGMLGLFIVNFLGSATLFLPAPSIVSVAIAGASLNPLMVAFVAGIASALGEGVSYIFGYSSTEVLNLKRHKRLYKISQSIIHWKGGILIVPFAFFPNPLFDGLGILAGISKFPLKKFIFLVFIGRFVRNIGIAYLGLFLW